MISSTKTKNIHFLYRVSSNINVICISVELFTELDSVPFGEQVLQSRCPILGGKKIAVRKKIYFCQKQIIAKYNKSIAYRDTRCPCINRYHKQDIKVNRVMAFALTGQLVAIL